MSPQNLSIRGEIFGGKERRQWRKAVVARRRRQKESNMAKCERCGKEAEDSTPRPDPFDEEIYDITIPWVLCDECYEQSALDI